MSVVKKPSARKKRGYRSPQREQQAEATRQRLVASARRLFAQRGYASTSIEAIARAAKVSVQTFYATFGSKQTLLFALLDTMETEADVPRLNAELAAATDPESQMRSLIGFGVRLYAKASDVLETIRGAGMGEKDLGALWREGEQRRRQAQRALVLGWLKQGALRPELDAAAATDIFWAMTGPDSYRLWVHECGWTLDRYERWLVTATRDLLLRA